MIAMLRSFQFSAPTSEWFNGFFPYGNCLSGIKNEESRKVHDDPCRAGNEVELSMLSVRLTSLSAEDLCRPGKDLYDSMQSGCGISATANMDFCRAGSDCNVSILSLGHAGRSYSNSVLNIRSFSFRSVHRSACMRIYDRS